ncbi:bifunctional diguanylate cyclase/phosphodiesterase [Pseudoalteromonas phenolica]|uniref:Diguanylate cyclase n=2 Tax=Pseudoalteromonas phenolica TaxID=161398 RepID=A0A0S2JYI1_9GAMM|nr:bifunctional diguanylate cyclase/phosphodiesterase [Pseudoalteromonas phenolica]ALO41084.1 hypothetical protein PP2015_562 [Pseudoalteromonas phenolica]MBE0354391.1 hypothetical protein [Pseudoalteromonas phenolica O-BC30]
MKLWHSLLLCLVIILCKSVFASQLNTQAIASQANNQHWFLYADDLIKYDGHNEFNAKQLTSELTAPFLSILSQSPFIWVGHQNGLSKVDTVTGETRTWLETPVTKISQTGNGIIFQSNGRLYQLVNTTLSVLPINLKQQLWQTSSQGVVYVSLDNSLMHWDPINGKKKLDILPFDADQLLLHQEQIILRSKTGEVFLFDETLQPQPLFSAENLAIFESRLLSFKNSFINSFNLNTQTQYQYQVNNLPIEDLKVSNQSIWLLQLGQWQKFQPASLTLQTDIENSEELKLYQMGMQAFHKFAKSQPVNAVRYIDGGRWAVATEQQIFIFSGEKGNFSPFIDKQHTQALYFTHDGNLWVRDKDGFSQFDLGSKERLFRYDVKHIHSITRLADNAFIASTSNALWLLEQGTALKLPLPFKSLIFHDVLYSKHNNTLLLSTESGLFELTFVNKQITGFIQRNQFSGKYLATAEEGIWQFDKQGIAHYQNRVTKRLVAPFQIQRQVLSFRQKLMLLNQSFSLIAEQVKTQSPSLALSHVRYHYRDKITESFSPKLPLTIETDVKRFSLWFNTCQSCQLHYRLSEDAPWRLLENNKLTLTPSEMAVLEVVASSQSMSKTLTVTASKPKQVWWHWILALTLTAGCVYWLLSKQLRASKSKLTEHFSDMLMTHSKDAIWLADEHFNVLKVNQAYSDITGFSADALVGLKPKIYTEQGRDRKLEQHIVAESQLNDYWTGEIWTLGANNQKLALDVTVTKLTHEDHPSEVFYLGVLTNISERKANEKALLNLSTRDSITGLANRTLFIESLNQAIASCNKAFPSLLLVLIDIDHFRKINDLMGHESGDALLKEVANRLSKHLDKGFTLARVSSDEFAVLIPPYLFSGMTIFFAKKLADDILKCINHPFTHQGVETSVSASCGLAIYPDDAIDSEHLIRCADSALDHAKHKGNNSYQFFDKQRHQLDPTILSRESALLRAIDDEQFMLFYQPKYQADSKELVGFEGLVRWQQDDGSIESPANFIPFAEECSAIIPMTNYLLDVACKQINHWRMMGLPNNHVAINISAKHFESDFLVDTVRECLLRYHIPAHCLELEITESAMMADPEQALKIMHRLKALGVTIALDDFGTGHSSLGYLKRFPIDILKIDRSFIMDIELSDQDRNITAAIIRLAKYLNITVVAEGVENERQAYLLNVMGCGILQGYYFSKPLPTDKATQLLENQFEETATLS